MTAKEIIKNQIYFDTKLILKFNFIDDTKLKITLIYACNEFLKKPNCNHIVYTDTKSNFTIWSYNSFSFNLYEFKLSDYKNYIENDTYIFNFGVDNDRRKFLKKLLNILNYVSTNKKIFIDNFNYTQYNNILTYKNYWILK